MTTHLENMENLKKSGNLKMVSEKSGETGISFVAELNYQ